MSNPRIDAIQAKLAKHPEWANLADWQVADLLNEIDDSLQKYKVNVAVGTARGVMLASGAWPEVVLVASDANANRNLRKACITVRDALSPPMEQLHTSDPPTLAAIEACLAALVSAGVLDSALRDDLLALADRSQSWAAIHCGSPVLPREIQLARGEE